jgi:hypothetical protein
VTEAAQGLPRHSTSPGAATALRQPAPLAEGHRSSLERKSCSSYGQPCRWQLSTASAYCIDRTPVCTVCQRVQDTQAWVGATSSRVGVGAGSLSLHTCQDSKSTGWASLGICSFIQHMCQPRLQVSPTGTRCAYGPPAQGGQLFACSFVCARPVCVVVSGLSRCWFVSMCDSCVGQVPAWLAVGQSVPGWFWKALC